jgi:hypothetical protein
MPQLSVCTRKWGLIRSIIPVPRSPQPKCLDEIRPFSRDADSWYSCFRRKGYGRRYGPPLWLTGHSSSSSNHRGNRTDSSGPPLSWLRLPAVTHVLVTDDGSAIAAAIREGRCVSVSDGSFKDQYGTSAWAIEAESSVDRCTRAGYSSISSV